MKLTFGMATIEDYDGVYFTLQAFRMYHEPILKSLGWDVEYIVVDNKPDSKSSPHVKRLVEYWIKGRYIEMPRPEGTTQSRNRIFTEATGDVVMCVDSHILLLPGAIESLVEYYQDFPLSPHLLSGPLMVDDLKTPNTHFDDVWRSEMWGIWGRAWECKGFYKDTGRDDQTTPCRLHFTVIPTAKGNWPHRLEMNPRPFYTHNGLPTCPRCGLTFPKESSPEALKAEGYIDLAYTTRPFEIPGQGLGLFACRKDAWLGFNENFTGFGGEELYIHTKYRQAGHKALCIPELKWAHRFGRPLGHPYHPTRHQKVRNYILGHQELGLSLDRLKEHFVGSKLLPEQVWEAMLSDPLGLSRLNLMPPPTSNLPQPRASLATVEEFLAWTKEQPRDLDQHVDKIAELAAQCDTVIEVTHRRESTVALLPAKKVISFNAEQDDLLLRLQTLYPNKLHVFYRPIDKPIPRLPERADLLFIDTVHHADRLYYELKNYAPDVNRWIVMHDTQLHAEKGEQIDGRDTPGLLPALRKFMQEYPEWSVLYHTDKQYGLTVIGKLPWDKPQMPSVITMAANFTKALSDYAADGAKNVTKEEYTQRLEMCTICDQRNNNRCAVCGCGLSAKAAMRSSLCPLGKWPDISPKESNPQG